jgi:hypothetical protein
MRRRHVVVLVTLVICAGLLTWFVKGFLAANYSETHRREVSTLGDVPTLP